MVRIIQSGTLRWTEHVVRMEEGSSAFKILTGKPAGNRSQGRPKLRWEDNIIIDLKGIVVNRRNWIDSAQESGDLRAFVNATLKFWVA